jgi:hypothetical protein
MLIIIYDSECLTCFVEHGACNVSGMGSVLFLFKVLICVHVLGFWRFVLERKLSCGYH